MFNSFTTALGALNANSRAVDVVGHNLANLNTLGFKRSAVSFHDLVSESFRQHTQGPIQKSGGLLDAAIEGEGFFVVRDETGQRLFTRAGNFRIDAAGNLLTATGEKVQGWALSSGAVSPATAIGDITVPLGRMRAPSATTEMRLDLNLRADGVVGEATGSFSTPIEVVDSLGATHVVTVNFTKTAANAWNWEITIPGDDVNGGTAGQPQAVSSGSLTFDAQGQLASPASTDAPLQFQVTGLANGAADLTVDWPVYTPDGTPRISQYALPSSVSGNSQNGVKAGEITGIALADGGLVVAHFSDGSDEVVGQIALARISNPDALADAGHNNFRLTPESATPAIGPAATGGRGRVRGESVESSTVDLAQEFTNLIVFQRSYQANARVITTADEMSQETLNIKR